MADGEAPITPEEWRHFKLAVLAAQERLGGSTTSIPHVHVHVIEGGSGGYYYIQERSDFRLSPHPTRGVCADLGQRQVRVYTGKKLPGIQGYEWHDMTLHPGPWNARLRAMVRELGEGPPRTSDAPPPSPPPGPTPEQQRMAALRAMQPQPEPFPWPWPRTGGRPVLSWLRDILTRGRDPPRDR
jgi:hypothetical protein